MDNVESAEAAGDSYSTTEAISAEGAISLVGTLFGSPFANAVYIGHPGWKSMGGRIGYSVATGVFVLALAWFGILAVFLNLVPVVAIAPILLYIGMLIGAQAFQTTPAKHAPAIVLGLVPHLAAWAKTLIDGAIGATGVPVTPELIAAMATGGVLYEGLGILGNGAILTGLVLAAIGVFVIERQFQTTRRPSPAAGAVLTFFGFMHGPAVGFGVTPDVALAYGVVAVFLVACSPGWNGSTTEEDTRRRRGIAPGRPERAAPVDFDAWIDSASAVVGLTIAEAHRPGVARFLALAAEMADLLEAVDARRRRTGARPGLSATRGRAGRMNDATSPFATAAEVAAGGGRRLSARPTAVAAAALARIAAVNGHLNAFTDVTAERALREAAAIDAEPRGGPPARAAGGRALRGEEPVRRRGPADPRRLAHQPRPPAGTARRGADPAHEAGRGDAARHPEHGRVRLRLHRRERARRRLPQPPRSRRG